MIEFQIDQRELDRALSRLGGVKHEFVFACIEALKVTVPETRRKVLEMLKTDIAIDSGFVRRAVKSIMYRDTQAQFRVYSKNLLLSDYEVNPSEQTARAGIRSRQWPGFTYKLRNSGDTYSSFGMATGHDGTGSTPFLAYSTNTGELRVMYRRNKNYGDEVLIINNAPSIQYHAANPEVEDTVRIVSTRLFHDALHIAVNRRLLRNGA